VKAKKDFAKALSQDFSVRCGVSAGLVFVLHLTAAISELTNISFSRVSAGMRLPRF
jgi:hypothetical protein